MVALAVLQALSFSLFLFIIIIYVPQYVLLPRLLSLVGTPRTARAQEGEVLLRSETGDNQGLSLIADELAVGYRA